jgi:hypothetical protein
MSKITYQFSAIPTHMTTNHKPVMGPLRWAVWEYIFEMNLKHGDWQGAYAQISSACGISRRSSINACRWLKARGYLKITQHRSHFHPSCIDEANTFVAVIREEVKGCKICTPPSAKYAPSSRKKKEEKEEAAAFADAPAASQEELRQEELAIPSKQDLVPNACVASSCPPSEAPQHTEALVVIGAITGLYDIRRGCGSLGGEETHMSELAFKEFSAGDYSHATSRIHHLINAVYGDNDRYWVSEGMPTYTRYQVADFASTIEYAHKQHTETTNCVSL